MRRRHRHRPDYWLGYQRAAGERRADRSVSGLARRALPAVRLPSIAPASAGQSAGLRRGLRRGCPTALTRAAGAPDKIPVRRHRPNTPLDARTQLFQLGLDLLRIEAVDQGIVAARDDVLPYHDREPTDHREQLGVLAQD